MKIIFVGDIVGKEARQKFIESIPKIKNEYEPDVLIVNAENAAAGFGLTKKIANQLLDAGVDAITLGNHAWDQKKCYLILKNVLKLLEHLIIQAVFQEKDIMN